MIASDSRMLSATSKRHDGWTPERRLRFLHVLAATRSVTSACAAAEMSRKGAYRLRRREPDDFGRAWDHCLAPAWRNLDGLLARHGPTTSVNGEGHIGAEGRETSHHRQFHQLRTASAEQREAWAAIIRRASGA